jgi:hypothetical protein
MAEVDSRDHKVLDLWVIPNPKASPIPLQGGVATSGFSTLDPVLVAFKILSFHCACDLVQGRGVAMASHEMLTHLRRW